MVFVTVVTGVGIAVVCCSILLVFNCVCHIFKKKNGFTNFEDDVESGRNVSMYPTNEGRHDASNITFEPLPDILAKTVSSRALRPRITCADAIKQAAASKLVTVYRPFPRNQLLYVKEIGLGWFGQVLQGSAENITADNRQNKVVVKILKDDATALEKSLFLEEIAPYRELEHANIIQLLGQCTETTPFLAVLEYPPIGDLKSYLLTHKSGPFIQFAIGAARGMTCMHKHSYIHHDFAARNCVLMSDMTVKIGDYGIGEDLYREDYYDTGRDLLPIRWMSPESLEVKQGVWQTKTFTFQSNVWSLSILLWEILAYGRKPFSNLRDEDVLHKVIRDGATKLPPPGTDIPLHDRWYEIMEMCWQEADDRPSADDILAFLLQIEEEVMSQSHDQAQTGNSNTLVQPTSPTATQQSSNKQFDSQFVISKNKKQSSQHVAEVLVHRVDDGGKQGFEDDFSRDIAIRKNTNSQGFEDDFIAGSSFNDLDLPQNDSILASGGSEDQTPDQRGQKDFLGADLMQPPVPVQVSTPSKATSNGTSSLSGLVNGSAAEISSKYTTAQDVNTNSEMTLNNNESVRSEDAGSKHSRTLFGEASGSQNSDEGYRTAENASTPPVLAPYQNDSTDDSESVVTKSMTKLNPKASDVETERAKEIYMSKGTALQSSNVHRSRSLGTIPEDGIPSDNTSQSGLVFDDQEESEDVGMNFEWDDYEGEQLVGRVRYMSDDSVASSASARSPRHVEVEEWPFDQDSNSDSHSKAGSVASDSDGEVTRLSLGSNTSIDTRARIASILTNRLNSLIKQTNSSYTSPGQSSSFYSISEYDTDIDPTEPAAFTDPAFTEPSFTEPAFTESDYWQGQESGDDGVGMSGASLSTVREEVELEAMEEKQLAEELHTQGQDEQLIKQDLEKIAATVLNHDRGDAELTQLPEVVVSKNSDPMLTSELHNSIA